jgi:hypothetical protein
METAPPYRAGMEGKRFRRPDPKHRDTINQMTQPKEHSVLANFVGDAVDASP